jgi:hypothetical protein
MCSMALRWLACDTSTYTTPWTTAISPTSSNMSCRLK